MQEIFDVMVLTVLLQISENVKKGQLKPYEAIADEVRYNPLLSFCPGNIWDGYLPTYYEN